MKAILGGFLSGAIFTVCNEMMAVITGFDKGLTHVTHCN